MVSTIWYLIVGGLIGWIAGLILGRDIPGGVIGNIVAGLIGSSVGGMIFKDFGPQLAGIAIVPAVLGAIILVLIVSWIFKSSNRRA